MAASNHQVAVLGASRNRQRYANRAVRALQQHGYDGFITAEVSFMVQARENYDPLAAATLSYETLSRAFTNAGIDRTR